MDKEILEFYKKTSPYTDLGYYKEFAKNLPNDIEELCLLQRMQIIHPVAFRDKEIRNKEKCFWGDMTKVEVSRLEYEDDIFPTAQSVIAELLRKNPNYNINREAKDKVHVTCRSQAIILASILKAKGIPARARSGFAEYIKYDEIYYDHWITEYYDEKEGRWKLVDPDMHCPAHKIEFDLNDIPYDKFLFGAKAYLGFRRKQYEKATILYSSDPPTLGLKAAIRGLFYDFHSLMNNEIIFLHIPKYIQDKKFELSEEEYKELDDLAELMLEPNKNFEKLQGIWEEKSKFRIMSGALN
ncbi:MAG: hypothetical protein HFJ42_08180 [Clostridia bacterium]|nr:hypothetical protein [Clostridia bacterium]